MSIAQTLLKHVTIQQLKDYLTSKGWTEELFGRKTALRFVAPPHIRCYDWDVFIPAFSEVVDYDRVVEIAVDCVAAFEDRTVDDVLSDLLPRTLVELVEIRALISECERLIRKHRDDFALKQSLESLRPREQNLVDEIAGDD